MSEPEALSAAEQLAAVLVASTDPKKWDWTAAPDSPANVTRKRWGAVWRTGLEPADKGRLRTLLTLNIYGAKAVPGKATERELDDALDDVLLALQRLPGWSLEKATRVTLKDVFAGWEIEVSKEHNNYYAEAVRRETEA